MFSFQLSSAFKSKLTRSVFHTLRTKNSLRLFHCRLFLGWRFLSWRFWHRLTSNFCCWQAEHFIVILGIVFLLRRSSLSFLSLYFHFWFLYDFHYLSRLSRLLRWLCIFLHSFWRFFKLFWTAFDILPLCRTRFDDLLVVSSSRILLIESYKRKC